jgi:hypothetical protein
MKDRVSVKIINLAHRLDRKWSENRFGFSGL